MEGKDNLAFSENSENPPKSKQILALTVNYSDMNANSYVYDENRSFQAMTVSINYKKY